MEKTITIKSSREFSRTFHRGKSFGDKFVVVFIIPNRAEINKIGVSIGKRVGNSVTRNRVKRLIRESYRLLESKLKVGYDIVFVPRQPSSEAEFKDIYNSLERSFKKLDMIQKEVV